MPEYNLVLASGSPRRKEILSMIGADYEIKTGNSNEIYDISTPLYDVPKLLAERKALAVKISDNDLILGFDTVVICENQILGKPKTKEKAIEMLKMLSGKVHSVVSGICVRTNEKLYSESVTTYVKMRPLSDSEIEFYVNTSLPLDKAGAYGIQESAGAFIEKIDGDFYNVVGLPLCRLCVVLKEKFGYDILTEGRL